MKLSNPPLITFNLGVQTESGWFTSIIATVDTGSALTGISRSVAEKLGLKLTKTGQQVSLTNDASDLCTHEIFEANLMLSTRDNAFAILDGFQIVLFPQGNEALIGLDCLSHFEFRITSDGLYLIREKPIVAND